MPLHSDKNHTHARFMVFALITSADVFFTKSASKYSTNNWQHISHIYVIIIPWCNPHWLQVYGFSVIRPYCSTSHICSYIGTSYGYIETVYTSNMFAYHKISIIHIHLYQSSCYKPQTICFCIFDLVTRFFLNKTLST